MSDRNQSNSKSTSHGTLKPLPSPNGVANHAELGSDGGFSKSVWGLRVALYAQHVAD